MHVHISYGFVDFNEILDIFKGKNRQIQLYSL